MKWLDAKGRPTKIVPSRRRLGIVHENGKQRTNASPAPANTSPFDCSPCSPSLIRRAGQDEGYGIRKRLNCALDRRVPPLSISLLAFPSRTGKHPNRPTLQPVLRTTSQSELIPCMDAVNQSYMTTVAMVKQYRPSHRGINRSQRSASVSFNINASDVRELAAVKIQALVRMHQAQFRWGERALTSCSRSHATYLSVGCGGGCSPNVFLLQSKRFCAGC